MNPPHAQATLPTSESTRGAWLGLLVMTYGAASTLIGTAQAGAAQIVRVGFDVLLTASREQEVEGVAVQGLHGALTDASGQYADLLPWVHVDAAVCVLLGFVLMATGFGICRRSPLGLQSTRVVLIGKAIYLAAAGVFLWMSLAEPFGRLRAVLVDLSDQLEELTYQSGGNGAAFREFQQFMVNDSQTAFVVSTSIVIASLAVAILVAYVPSTREWCKRVD